MKFWEAMKAVDEGKKVKLRANEYLYEKDKEKILFYMESEWEIYEEPVQTFSFIEVIKGLKEGKKFRRRTWPNSTYCVHLTPIGICESYTSNAWFAYPKDYEATDWIEVK